MVMNLGSSNDQQQLLPFIGLQDHRLFTYTLLFNALRVLFQSNVKDQENKSLSKAGLASVFV